MNAVSIPEAAESESAWARYNNLMVLCRNRGFAEAFDQTSALGPIDLGTDPTVADPQPFPVDPTEDRVTDLIIRARICHEFRRVAHAAHYYWTAATELEIVLANHPETGEPFVEAARWLTAAALSTSDRTPQPQRLQDEIVRHPIVRHWSGSEASLWYEIYRYGLNSNGERLDTDARPDLGVAGLEQAERVEAWCRWYRRAVRRRNLDVELRTEAHAYLTEAVEWATALTGEGDTGEGVYDRVLGLAPIDKNIVYQLAAYYSQIGNYLEAEKHYSKALEDDPVRPGSPLVEASVGLSDATRRYGRNSDEGELLRIEAKVETLHAEGFMPSKPSESPDWPALPTDSNELPVFDHPVFAHRAIGILWRQRATLQAATQPDQGYESLVFADRYLEQIGLDRGWSSWRSPVRSFNRPSYLVQIGRAEQAKEEACSLLNALNLPQIGQRLVQLLDEPDQPYDMRSRADDWRMLLADTAARLQEPTSSGQGLSNYFQSQLRARIAMDLVAAAGLLHSLGRSEAALSWLDALSFSPDKKRSDTEILLLYLQTIRIPGPVDQGFIDTVEAIDEPFSLPTSLRYIPLARALAIRHTVGLASSGLVVAEEVFGFDDCRSRAEDLAAIKRYPDELIREVARAKLEMLDFDHASLWYSALAESAWETGLTAGVCGLFDLWRRSGDLARIRAAAASTRHDEGKMAINDTQRICVSNLSNRSKASITIAEAWAEVQIGSHHRGEALFLRAIPEVPQDISGWLGLARAWRILGYHRKSIDLLQWLLDQREKPPLGYPELADTTPMLAVQYRTVLLAELGWSYIGIDEVDKAADCFESAIGLGSYLVSAHRGRLHASFRTSRQLDRAFESSISDLSKWFGPETADGSQVAAARELVVERGRIHARRREVDLAKRCFGEVIAATNRLDDPTQRRIMRVLTAAIDAMLEAHELASAIAFYEELEAILETSSSQWRNSDVMALLSIRLNLALGQSEKALRLAQEQLRYRAQKLAGLSYIVGSGPSISRVDSSTAILPEALVLAEIVAIYENRQFDQALETLDLRDAGTKLALQGLGTGEKVPFHPGDQRNLVRAWTHLARSELPGYDRGEGDVALAQQVARELDGTSTHELHLRAIVSAQAVRQRFRLRARPNQTGPSEGEVATGYSGCAVAVDSLKQALVRQPYSASLHRDLAGLELLIGDLKKADEGIAEAERLAPNDARVWLLKGFANYRRGQYRLAAQQFRAATAYDPRDFIHHRAQVIALLRADDIDDARLTAEYGYRVIESDRKNILGVLVADAWIRQASTLRRSRRGPSLNNALTALDRIRSDDQYIRDLVALRRAAIAAAQGHQRRADMELDQIKADGQIVHRATIRQLRAIDQQPSALQIGAPWLRVLWIVLTIVSAGFVSWMLYRSVDDGRVGSPTALLGLPFLFAALMVFSFLGDRLSSIRIQSISADLIESRDPNEIVHIDLDLSASRLLLISGLSNYRPEVEYNEIEPRFLPPAS